jgi:hypothetical protein
MASVLKCAEVFLFWFPDLVAYSDWNDGYYKFLENRFYIVRQLRDIFGEMEKNKQEDTRKRLICYKCD